MTEESSDFVQIRNLNYGPSDVRKTCFLWCPACALPHTFVVEASQSPVWTWDGSLEKPTFEPSLLVRGGSRGITCHSFLRKGKWEFLGDSTHSLAGQVVDMVPLPLWLRKEGLK